MKISRRDFLKIVSIHVVIISEALPSGFIRNSLCFSMDSYIPTWILKRRGLNGSLIKLQALTQGNLFFNIALIINVDRYSSLDVLYDAVLEINKNSICMIRKPMFNSCLKSNKKVIKSNVPRRTINNNRHIFHGNSAYLLQTMKLQIESQIGDIYDLSVKLRTTNSGDEFNWGIDCSKFRVIN